jgi:hypothetical protein
MVITHHTLQHILSALSQHTGYSVVYLIAVVPTLFPKKSELCSNKNRSPCVEEECTGWERATDWGVCSACGGSSWAVQAWSWNIRVCLLGLKIIMWDFKASASSRAEGKCAFSNFTTNVSTKNLTCYLIKIVILLLGFVYSSVLATESPLGTEYQTKNPFCCGLKTSTGSV